MQCSAFHRTGPHQGRSAACFQHQGTWLHQQSVVNPNSNTPHQNFSELTQSYPRWVAPCSPAPGALGYPPYSNNYRHVLNHKQQHAPFVPDPGSNVTKSLHIPLQNQTQEGNHPNPVQYVDCFSLGLGNHAARQQNAPFSAKPLMLSDQSPCPPVGYHIDILERAQD